MMHNCPLCGSKAILPQVAIVLGQNILVVDDQPIRLRPKEAELAHVLWKVYPAYVNTSCILASIYGDQSNWPTEGQVRFHIKRLRIALFATRLEIDHRYGLGYRLVLKDHAATTH